MEDSVDYNNQNLNEQSPEANPDYVIEGITNHY